MARDRDPEPRYRVLVRYSLEDPKWYEIHRGPVNAFFRAKLAGTPSVMRRVYPIPTERDVVKVFNLHPDLSLMEKYLDNYYVIEGSVEDRPNRRADFEWLEFIQRREAEIA
ncbi:hypothetical protein ACFWY9_28680 [Amycolatopsis sp. NPDC059027]|uniref:hypothetical protein n=1 Tax=Amycolatopsis sp. NPDC059027 TaxID=3346709 RepID=UPI00366B6196